MTSLNRLFLIVLILQIECLALDHSISELEYEEDDQLRLLVGNAYPTDPLGASDSSAEDASEGDVISFDPKTYDFLESPVGMPRLGVVRIDNRLKTETVKLISISGNTINFHSSFFANQLIGPGNFTSFEVVFLSREEGQFNSVLFIHTSKGLYKYHVQGIGLPNPYRLRPLVGAKIPVNASYEPIITLHNPHDTRILVVEMLSSGTDFSLKLPTNVEGSDPEGEGEGGGGGGGTPWSIEPFQTKSVMQGSFQGKTEGNHTGFIRIKVNHTAASGEYLMVPVEVQVSSSPGIYSPQESLDFGLLVRSDKPKTLSLSLINAQPTPVNIQSVVVRGEFNPTIRIEFRPLTVEPDTRASTVIALITFDPSLHNNPSQSNGFIEVRSECGKSISVPFTASVLEGELEYNASSLGFYVKAESGQPRNFSVRNKFSSAVAIYQVSVTHPDIIQVESLNQSHVITPGEQKTICTLKVQKKYALCDSKSTVQLTVKSNITNLKLPITCYDGRLQLFSVESGKLDFGRVELYSTYTEYIAVQNKNPIEVRLKSWGSNSSWSQVELVGMQKGVMEDLLFLPISGFKLPRTRDFDNLKKSLFLQPGQMAVFSVDIRRPTVEGMFYGESYVTTDQNQTLRSPFKFMVSRGSVSSETLFFDKAFPGKISFEKLYVTSTFNQTLKLVNVRSNPPSALWFAASTLQTYPEIPPEAHRKSLVGKVHFDPRKFCLQNCYTGFTLESKFGKDWIRGVILNWETGEIDLKIWNTLQSRFSQIKDEIVSNMSLWLDTNGPTGFKIKAQTRYTWPRLASQKSVLFPLTSIGNETFLELILHNPSNGPVIVQAAMAQDYGPSWTHFIQDNLISGNATEGGVVFSIKDVSWPSSQFNGSGNVDVRKMLQKYHPDLKDPMLPGIIFVLPPSSKISLNLKFAPLSNNMASTLLLLRNNLTGVEGVMMKGRAGTGQLTVGNGTPGSSLMFQMTEGLLQGCEKFFKKEDDSLVKPKSPQVTVRRSFVARNIGEIPLEILSLMVYPRQSSLWSWAVVMWMGTERKNACEGYGFKILNCHPFTLQPNQTHSIDIAFTPDFTLSKVRSTLLLTDSTGNSFNYTLIALIPSNMLAKCATAIARPWWEWYLKVGAISGSMITFIAASLVLYFDASGVISNTVLATVRVLPRGTSAESMHDEREQTQRLDLKAVYDKVENRFRRNQVECQNRSHIVPACTSQSAKGAAQNKFVEIGSNLRNRKGNKKPSNDLNITSPPAGPSSNKLADKMNHNNGIHHRSSSSNNNNTNTSNIQMGIAVEEVVATYNMNMNIKKEKENIVGNNVPSSGSNNTTTTTTTTTTGKKKKGNTPPQQNQPNNKVRKGQNKIENFAAVMQQQQQKKTEEETSSTTTESSNPDEIVQESERKINNKIPNSNQANKTKHTTRREKKQQQQQQQPDSSSSENISNFSESFSDRTHESKKVYTKKKESTSYGHPTSGGDNNAAATTNKPELWDTPRPPSGNGLSELAAQTEAFVLQRPKKRNASGDIDFNYVSGSSSSNSSRNIPNMNSYQMNMAPQHPIPSYAASQQQQQQRSRKPGVIGQPRSQPQSHPQGNFGSHPHSISPSNPAYNHPTGYCYPPSYPQSAGPTSRPHLTPSTGSIWDNENILNNGGGCDMWGRRSMDPAPPSNNNFFHSPPDSFTLLPNVGFGSTETPPPPYYGGGGTSSTGSSSGLPPYGPSDNRYPFSRLSQGGNNFSSNPVNGTSVVDPSTHLYGNNGGGNGGFGNNNGQRTQASPPSYTESTQYRRPQQSFANNNGQHTVGIPTTSSAAASSGMTQHGYLQRMRSDPTIRSQQSSSPTPTRPPWIGTVFAENEMAKRRLENEEKESNPWIPTTTANDFGSGGPDGSYVDPFVITPNTETSSYPDWKTVGPTPRSISREAQIWESNVVGSGRWPPSSSSSAQATTATAQPSTTTTSTSFTDSGMVGSVSSRLPMATRQEDSNTTNTAGLNALVGELPIRAPTSDMTRELEAGLGFNPFTSDIWNHSEATPTQSWGSYTSQKK